MVDRKLTPFEDKLVEIIVSNQGLLTFDACVDAAVRETDSLLWFAKEELKLPKWKKTEPEPGHRYVLLFDNSGGVVESDDYRPKDKKFYYSDGDYYNDVSYNDKSLVGWMYLEELKKLAKE
ncbi:MAG: hypothetical protein J6X18_07955 [Bacteroidales bacterium]|nr:hypothetical protein [Bacteroidales bacterium]